jgi:hypothetical protein
MVKKVYLQIIGILLLLFVSGNIVATSIDVFAKSKYTYTELRYSEEIDEVDDFEENSDDNELSDFDFLNYFSAHSECVPVYIQFNLGIEGTSKFLFGLEKRPPKTPFFIQYKQLKISC